MSHAPVKDERVKTYRKNGVLGDPALIVTEREERVSVFEFGMHRKLVGRRTRAARFKTGIKRFHPGSKRS